MIRVLRGNDPGTEEPSGRLDFSTGPESFRRRQSSCPPKTRVGSVSDDTRTCRDKTTARGAQSQRLTAAEHRRMV